MFVWAATFSGIAILLRIARDLTFQEHVSVRDVVRAIIDAATVVFFGGLFGWAMALIFPNVTNEFPTMLAIGAALISYSGLTALQDSLYRLFARFTGLPLRRSDDTSRPEDEER